MNSDGQRCHLYQQEHVFALPEAVHGFQMLYAVVFMVASGFEVRGGFVDIDGIVDQHGLKTFSHNHISHRLVKYKKVSLPKHIHVL